MRKPSSIETADGYAGSMSLRCREICIGSRCYASCLCNLVFIVFIILISLVGDSSQGANEKRLLNELFNIREYNKLERPVYNDTEPLVVRFGLVLQQIIDVDEKYQIINTNLWLNMHWTDYSLVWNETEFGGIKSIRVPPSVVWKPDILMYNSADEDIDSTFPTNVIVSSTGDCLWVPPGLFLSTCTIDITWFPFDDQFCKMKFGSWTYDSSGIDLQLQSDSGDLSSFILNGEWQLIGMPALRNVVSYDCCPEQYIDVTFTVHIRRRTLFYGFNLIIPCVLISSIALLTFTLPPESGEKISLGVTILLSLTVFLLLVAEAMPPTSDALPLIGMYFAAIMLMCSLSVVFTVLVLNYHHRTPSTHVMPKWVKKIICEWLSWLVRMQRPGHAPPQFLNPTPILPHRMKRYPNSSLQPEVIGLTTKFSRSLLANVLDSGKSPLSFISQNGNASCNHHHNSSTTDRLWASATTEDYLTRRALSKRVCPSKISSSSDMMAKQARKDSTINERYSRNASLNVNGYAGMVVCGINGHIRKMSQGVEGNLSNTAAVNSDGHPGRAPPSMERQQGKTSAGIEGHQRETPIGIEGHSNPNKNPYQPDVSPSKNPAETESYLGQTSPSQGPQDTTMFTPQDTTSFTPFVHLSNGTAHGNYVPLSCRAEGSGNHGGSHREPMKEDKVTETLGEILRELRFLGERVKSKERDEMDCNDWKFAAMVIDRVCLISFTIFTVASTFAILFSAPHVIA